MKFKEAIDIINGEHKNGYMVSFEVKSGPILCSDHFPDKHAGEELIKTEADAWVLARQFAEKTKGKCIHIYVIGSDFRPVPGYRDKIIENR